MILSQTPSRPHDRFCPIDPCSFISPFSKFFFNLFFSVGRSHDEENVLGFHFWRSPGSCLPPTVSEMLDFFLRFINIVCKPFRVLMESSFPLTQAVKCRVLLKPCLRNKPCGTLSTRTFHPQIQGPGQGWREELELGTSATAEGHVGEAARTRRRGGSVPDSTEPAVPLHICELWLNNVIRPGTELPAKKEKPRNGQARSAGGSQDLCPARGSLIHVRNQRQPLGWPRGPWDGES